jgi:hypothetical protein
MTRRLLTLPVVALLVLSACGGGGTTGDRDTLEAMLGMVPDTGPNRQYLLYGNLARLRGDDGADEAEADLQALLEVSKGSFVVANPLRDAAHDVEGLRAEAGFGLTDVDASMEAGQPPETLSVFTGRLDGEQIDQALTGSAAFAEQVQADERGDYRTYAVGEGGGSVDVAGVSLLRPIGQSLRIGVGDGTMWLAHTDEVLDGALDTAAGGAPALADDAAYAAVAQVMDRAEAFNVTLPGDASQFTADAASILGPRTTPEQAAEVQQQIDAGTLGIGPWQVAGLADAPGELLVVLSHADEAAAQDNAERLRRTVEEATSAVTAERWSERLSVTSIEVDGTLVEAHLKSDVPMATQIVLNRDTLIMIAR